MTAEETSVDRRKLIKAMGAGTAIAWVAPSVVGTASAFAQAGGSGSCTAGFVCGQPIEPFVCGDDCFCITTTSGAVVCSANFSCGDAGSCNSDADCGAGFVCQGAGSGCCGANVCAPICAGAAAVAAGAGTNAG